MPRILETNQMRATHFEPKRKNQFQFMMDGVPAFLIKTTSLPEWSSTTQKIDYMNTYFKVAGKGEWNPISLTLYDPIIPSATQAVMEWLRLHYETMTGRAGYQDFYKKDVAIELFGPPGDEVSRWVLYGAFIESSNFGDLDFSSDGEPMEISLTLQYDRPELQY